MKNKSIKILLSLTIMSCLAFTACGHEHTFSEATCTTAKTCTDCGEIQDEALGHTWLDATCESAKTCSVCNVTEGEPLNHSWIEATETDPKTCELCGLTDGEPVAVSAERGTVDGYTAPSDEKGEGGVSTELGEDDYKADDPNDAANMVIPSADGKDPNADSGIKVSESGAGENYIGFDYNGDGVITNAELKQWQDEFDAISDYMDELEKQNGSGSGSNSGNTSGGSSQPGPTNQQGGLPTTPEDPNVRQIIPGSGDASGAENAIIY